MSRSYDREYHRARAQAEIEMAERAADPAVARIHRELAALHRRQMLEIIDEAPPTTRVMGNAASVGR